MSFVWRIVTTGMTTTFAEPHRVHHRALARSAVARRMLPLQVASLCQGMMLWVPVEKLFMSKIGFTPASIGLMGRRLRHRCSGPGSPVGLLADRWSRKGVLVAATVALVLAVAIGAAANTVGMCAFGTLVEPHRRELRALLPHARLLQRRRRTHPRHLPQSMAGPPTIPRTRHPARLALSHRHQHLRRHDPSPTRTTHPTNRRQGRAQRPGLAPTIPRHTPETVEAVAQRIPIAVQQLIDATSQVQHPRRRLDVTIVHTTQGTRTATPSSVGQPGY